jgi:hypothetical protein
VGRVESYGAVTLPLALIQQSAWKVNSANFVLTAFSEVRVGFYRKNNTGTIERRLRSARSQQTKKKKKIASKVMYDSWLLEWTNNNPEEITNPLSSTAASLRTGPTSKTYQNSTP